MLRAFLKLSVCTVLLVFTSCTYDSITPAKILSALPDTVSFRKNILPIFINNCDNPGCHAGAIPSNRINLDSAFAYSQLMKKGSGYVDTLNPPASVIYVSIISVSDPMPPSGKLNDYSIQLVLKWIQQGAKNN